MMEETQHLIDVSASNLQEREEALEQLATAKAQLALAQEKACFACSAL